MALPAFSGSRDQQLWREAQAAAKSATVAAAAADAAVAAVAAAEAERRTASMRAAQAKRRADVLMDIAQRTSTQSDTTQVGDEDRSSFDLDRSMDATVWDTGIGWEQPYDTSDSLSPRGTWGLSSAIAQLASEEHEDSAKAWWM